MKKFVLTIVSILLLSIGFSGCNLVSIQDKDLADAPGVAETSGGITLTIYRYSTDTRYINIYREDVSDTANGEIVNLGIIFPSAYGSDARSYLLEDKWIENGHKYQYMVRYAEADGLYYNSEWSSTATCSLSLQEAGIKYDTTNSQFNYNKADYTLTIHGAPIAPALDSFTIVEDGDNSEKWKPVLAVKAGSVVQVFSLESIADNTIINLRGLLSAEFLNTEIQILGILGQKEIYTKPTDGSTPVIKMILWTLVSEIPIEGYSGNLITITSESGTAGYDFSYNN